MLSLYKRFLKRFIIKKTISKSFPRFPHCKTSEKQSSTITNKYSHNKNKPPHPRTLRICKKVTCNALEAK